MTPAERVERLDKALALLREVERDLLGSRAGALPIYLAAKVGQARAAVRVAVDAAIVEGQR